MPRAALQKKSNLEKHIPLGSYLLFLYLWQLAGAVHISSHWLFATLFGVPARIQLAWQKFVPVYGWVWDKYQPHTAFMCHYDVRQLQAADPWQRVSVGFAGPYCQLIYMLAIGFYVKPVPMAVSGYKNCACANGNLWCKTSSSHLFALCADCILMLLWTTQFILNSCKRTAFVKQFRWVVPKCMHVLLAFMLLLSMSRNKDGKEA